MAKYSWYASSQYYDYPVVSVYAWNKFGIEHRCLTEQEALKCDSVRSQKKVDQIRHTLLNRWGAVKKCRNPKMGKYCSALERVGNIHLTHSPGKTSSISWSSWGVFSVSSPPKLLPAKPSPKESYRLYKNIIMGEAIPTTPNASIRNHSSMFIGSSTRLLRHLIRLAV